MQAKEQFLQDKKLSEWWSNISHDVRFDRVMLHASAAALEGLPTEEQRTGAIGFREILLTLSDMEAPSTMFAKPGLNHDIEPKPRAIDLKEKPETKAK